MGELVKWLMGETDAQKERAERAEARMSELQQTYNEQFGPKCPRCNSKNLTVYGKKFSTGKAIIGATIGAALLGPAGIVGTAAGSTNKVEFICLDCGRKWKQ